MFILFANIINIVANIFIWLVIADSLLSFFLDTYHPVRVMIGKIVNPMLVPIRRIVPLVGMFDLSPLILIVLISILSGALVRILYAL